MAFDAALNKINDSWEQLSSRERLMVTAGGILAIICICFTSWFMLSRKVDLAQTRLNVKTTQLTELVKLQSTFSKREMEGRQIQNKLKANKIRLVSHLESASKAAGVEIGNMTPRDSSPDADGIIETTVTIKVQKLSVTRLQDFISRIENSSQGLVFIRRMHVTKRFDDKSLLDLELTISTYKIS